MKPLFIVLLLILASPLHAAPDHLKEGNAYLSLNRLQKAAMSFEYAIKANPENAEAYKGLGMVYYRLGNNDVASDQEMLYKSINSFSEAVRIKPDVDSYYYIGVIWLVLGEKENSGKVYDILKNLDKQKSDELAAKISDYKEPEKYQYQKKINMTAERKEAREYPIPAPLDRGITIPKIGTPVGTGLVVPF